MDFDVALRVLLSKGYFPSELPPNFTTVDFGTHASQILDAWEKSGLFERKPVTMKGSTGKLKKRDAYLYSLTAADSEIISKPKRGFERRNIHITHPIPQALLSFEMSSHWKLIQKWLSRQRYTLDKVQLSPNYSRGVSGIDFAVHQAKKDFIESCNDWIVKTDITRFYPSIYTHSIAWAAYGKGRVKSNLKFYDGSVADRLDRLVRACNRNQTIGIPIGPETSRVIAEIISSRIDLELNSLVDINADCVDRFQDDWFVGTETLEEAEKLLSGISRAYRDYGLEINGSKTAVERMIDAKGADWLSELLAFLSHRSGPLSGTRLQEFLRLSLRLQIHNKNEPIINYVLAVIESSSILRGNVQIVESFLIKSALISPISMDRICRIILNLKFRTKDISVRRIEDRFTLLAQRCVENDHLFELMWIMYTFRGLRIKLRSKDLSDKFERLNSSAIALILLDMDHLGLCPYKLPKAEWAQRADPSAVSESGLWLLAYEGIRHGWLADPHKLMNASFFKAMNIFNVKFYDETRNVAKSENVVRRASRLRKISKQNVIKMLVQLRGVGDY